MRSEHQVRRELDKIDRHILRNYVYLHAIEHGLDLPIGTQDFNQLDPGQTDIDTVTGSAPGEGPRPESIQAQCLDVDGVDEMFSALLRYPGGVTASLHSGFNAQFRMAAEIVGTNGALEIPQTYLGNTGTMTLITGDQRQEIPVPESDRYQLQLEDFADAILEKRTPLLTAAETVRNLEVIEQLYAAARRS